METDIRGMVETMMQLQDGHNKKVHADWRTQGYDYYRAIWTECAELMDHYGWKWWKKQERDIEQVKLEIIDIWHFGLSDLMRSNRLEIGIKALEDLRVEGDQSDPSQFRSAVERLAELTLVHRSFPMDSFCDLLKTCQMSVEELFKLYVGKNVLNDFRQDHGYKTGKYKKIWDGREDNEHLMEILHQLDCASDEVPQKLYEGLQNRYR